jgi:TM2 domain-containing membrane protein YozV
MNCAVHPETTATAYCRTCGKALCSACVHTVKGVVYCEDCLAHRLGDAVPAAPSTVVAAPPVIIRSGPSPGLAAVLSVFFPFGVGQVYNGQYAKGLAHLLVFAGLVWGASEARGGFDALFGISIAFFYVYQIVDAVRSAHAIQRGEPAPDPFGLARTFSAGNVSPSQIPVGAVILIGIGVLFLLNTMGLFEFHWIGRLWPVVLIVIGVWLFIKRVSPPNKSGVSHTE